ncbi:hypothetical protein [Moorena sp. SIO4G3]|uniref:hypothetical protein n=1 Tax=Moorena sp. SIO4G3 TaxID=2607821 RepID=UPI00142C111E|nr:hypothetical protein [Moorena sp. SIO4G3]NEO74894.1 hypothetical protein [Moorena sp. SIO4G3]
MGRWGECGKCGEMGRWGYITGKMPVPQLIYHWQDASSTTNISLARCQFHN